MGVQRVGHDCATSLSHAQGGCGGQDKALSKAEKGQTAAGFELKRAGLRLEPSQLKLLQTWILQTLSCSSTSPPRSSFFTRLVSPLVFSQLLG